MPNVRTKLLVLGGAGLAAAPLLLAALVEAGCSSDAAATDLAPTPNPSPTATSTPRDAGGPVDAGVDADDPNCLGDVPDGGGACPTTGACAAACANVAKLYKESIAQAVARCIAARASCTRAADVSLCLDNALARSCSEATATAYCTPIVLACDPSGSGSVISQAGCEKFARGFNAEGRTTFSACLTDTADGGTCERNVPTCAAKVRP